MKLHTCVLTVATLVVTAGMAMAEGLAFRDVSTGLWTDIAAKGDTRAGGFFAGIKFAAFSTKAKASIAGYPGGACGAARSLAVFSAKFVPAAPNTGIFMYDSLTGAISDVAIEGLPEGAIAGNWGAFPSTVAPVVAIDPFGCLVHVFFRYQSLLGPPVFSDTGIVDLIYGLPGLGFLVGAIRAQEGIASPGVTAPPSPFPAGAKFDNFDPATTISGYTSSIAGGTPFIAFPAKVRNDATLVPPVVAANDTGIFVATTFLLGGYPRTAVREGDAATCGAPPWPGAGLIYDAFPPTTRVSLESGVTPPAFTPGPYAYLVFPAKSKPASATDSAVVVQATALAGAPLPSCGNNTSTFPLPGGSYPAPFVAAYKGAVSPVGGTYAAIPLTAQVAVHGGCGAAFEASIAGVPGPPPATKALIVGGNGACATTAIATQKTGGGTLIASAYVSLPADQGPAVNPVTLDTLYYASPFGFSVGLFQSVGVTPGPLLSFLGRNPQVDATGNMTARFP